jgi:hypothetical protein
MKKCKIGRASALLFGILSPLTSHLSGLKKGAKEKKGGET